MGNFILDSNIIVRNFTQIFKMHKILPDTFLNILSTLSTLVVIHEFKTQMLDIVIVKVLLISTNQISRYLSFLKINSLSIQCLWLSLNCNRII